MGDIQELGDKIGYQFIRTGNPDNTDNRSSLSIFGISLCDSSEKDIQLFMKFLRCIVKKVLDAPLKSEITNAELAELNLSTKDLSFLAQMVNGANFTTGATYNPKDNSFRLNIRFKDVLKYKQCETFEDYIKLNLDFIPKIRFGGNYIRQEPEQTSQMNWLSEDQTSDSPHVETRTKQAEILEKIKEHDETYYNFSVFVSHSNRDYLLLHNLLVLLIHNRIKPVLWFEKIKDETVMDKLCNMINASDLFLIHMSHNSVHSQMTNNEIGFIEGRKYYLNQNERILRLWDESLRPEDFQGFYNKAFDGFDYDATAEDDNREVIKRLYDKFNSLPDDGVQDYFVSNLKELKKIILWIKNEKSHTPEMNTVLKDTGNRVDELLALDREYYPRHILQGLEKDLGICISLFRGKLYEKSVELRKDVVKLIEENDEKFR